MLKYQAHKGVSAENPENTMPAFEAAVMQGYSSIELDVAVTADGVPVLLHDETVNRTARRSDGSCIEEPLYVGDMTLAELRQLDFGCRFSRKFRGTAIPTLAEVISFVKGTGVRLKIDNKYQRFTDAEKQALFAAIRGNEDVCSLTCSSADSLREAALEFPAMAFHYDGPVDEAVLAELSAMLPKEKLTVWLPLECPGTSWVTVPFASASLAKQVKEMASLGIWILSSPQHLAAVEALGADIIETDGQLKPAMNRGVVADMHTHSECSHDSVCPLSAMKAAQDDKGTLVFASTDHCDILSHRKYDIFAPIAMSVANAKALGVLSGVEISEAIWLPEVFERMLAANDYDVVIGSVHEVEYKVCEAYSKTDFSAFTDTEIREFLAIYFADVLSMVRDTELDIMAHLTCPLRYIVGKFGRSVDITEFYPVIDEILSLIIKKGIALEVNTSSYGALDDFMPSKDIIRRYRAMGGYLVTLGSDAHVAENASNFFSEALEFLRETGFSDIFYLKNRKLVPCRIDIASF